MQKLRYFKRHRMELPLIKGHTPTVAAELPPLPHGAHFPNVDGRLVLAAGEQAAAVGGEDHRVEDAVLVRGLAVGRRNDALKAGLADCAAAGHVPESQVAVVVARRKCLAVGGESQAGDLLGVPFELVQLLATGRVPNTRRHVLVD